MKKIDKKQLKIIIKKLKPFWKKHRKLELEFREKEDKLKKIMNKSLKLDTEIEFFYCDGECCGIGASDFSNRKYFPLIHDRELEG